MQRYFSPVNIILICSIAIISIPFNTFGQCTKFINDQIPKLSPFIYNGRINTAILNPGDHSELSLVFYSGKKYRIMLKSTESHDEVAFIIKDAKNNLLFSSAKQNADYYDFTSSSIQQLTIEMIAAAKGSKPIDPSECVCVLVGEQE